MSIISDASADPPNVTPPTNPSLWGQEAKELAQADGADAGTGNERGSEMGEHIVKAIWPQSQGGQE